MSHDQLSKSLIVTFFHDFLRLIAPDAVPRLRPREATFVDKELFTDWPTGQRRELDLLAQVPVEEGAVPVLVHVEIESRARGGMDQRLWHYYMQIRLRHGRLVLPILVNLRGGRPGVGLEVLEEGVERSAPVTFPYRVLGLSGCRAEDWLTRPEPVAWAFAALMRPGKWSRAELKLECLRRVARSEVIGREKEVLVNWLQTCVKLSGRNAAEYQRLLELEENKEIREMDTSWLGKAEARGVKRGMKKGRAEAVVRMRQAVLLGLERRFGTVPPRVRRRLEAIHSIERLAAMVERLPVVETASDLIAPERTARADS
ncbi:MAG TPA: hypothetical protein VKM72_36075 [Thermoanaerobaculia bacterium]|nr:hypothetical protein [Thermoanaerobaculia bacterium]